MNSPVLSSYIHTMVVTRDLTHVGTVIHSSEAGYVVESGIFIKHLYLFKPDAIQGIHDGYLVVGYTDEELHAPWSVITFVDEHGRHHRLIEVGTLAMPTSIEENYPFSPMNQTNPQNACEVLTCPASGGGGAGCSASWSQGLPNCRTSIA
jgi:hypothetical protein